MPALLRSVGLPAHTAVGTNLVVGFLLGAAGFAGHLASARRSSGVVLAVSLVGAIPGAWLGARLLGPSRPRTRSCGDRGRAPGRGGRDRRHAAAAAA